MLQVNHLIQQIKLRLRLAEKSHFALIKNASN